MKGKAIIVDSIFGIYNVKIVNFDEGNKEERHEGGLTRNKAFDTAYQWSNETGYPVRIQSGQTLSLVEKRDQTHYHINQ